jgi:hypothetical protein
MKTLCVVLALLGIAGCGNGRATPQACDEIFDRIVELELRELGFRDPALLTRKRAQLRRVLAPEIERCHGRPLPEDALRCLRGATSTEQVSHGCLRR